MTVRRLAIVICCFVACAGLLAGCGGDGADKGEYKAGLKRLQGQLADAKDASNGAGPSATAAQRTDALAKAHASLDKAADTAAKLDPPDDAKAANRKLVAALRDYSDLFGKLAKLGENDPAESELYSEAGQIVDRLDSANRALAKAGYSVKGDD